MVFSSRVFCLVTLVSGYVAAPTAAEAVAQPLPWDGRGFDLTVDTLEDKYMTHILTMRNNRDDGKPSDYVTIDQKGRSPAYNGDTGVINVAVDAKAIFKKQKDFRRSEFVQNISSNTQGTTFFRTSMMKEEAFLNPYAWQAIFTESHIFEIRVDASKSPAKLIYLNNGTWDPKWETNFVPGTWHNFGFAICAAAAGKGSVVKFYMSEGDKDLALTKTHEVDTEFPPWHEFHFGLLTLSGDKSEPKMNAKQDIMSFNGVSVEDKVVTAAVVDVEDESDSDQESSDSDQEDIVKGADGNISFK